MKILHTLRKIGAAVVRTIAILYVALCVCGSFDLCFCNPDPDNCGEHCHDCEDCTENECRHFSVDVDDFTASHTEVAIPIISAIANPLTAFAPIEISFPKSYSRVSTVPIDSGGGHYLSYSTRVHPLA